MNTYKQTINEIIDDDNKKCPLPIDIIPNYMGINLCSVDSIMWQKQDDKQLVSLIITFIPSNESNEDKCNVCRLKYGEQHV